MNYFEITEELLYYYENEDFQDLIDRLDEIDDELVSAVFMSMYCLVNGEVEEAINLVKGLDIDKHLVEEKEVLLERLIGEVLLKIQDLEVLEKVCMYFYQRSGLIEMLFPFYDTKIIVYNEYEDIKEEIKIIVSEASDYSRFSYAAQYWIIYELSLEKDERFYNFALQMNEGFLFGSDLYYNIINEVRDLDNYQFIVEFIEKILPMMEMNSYNEIDAYSVYVKAKYNLKKEITEYDMHVLSKVRNIFIENYKICLENFEKFNETEVKKELLRVLNKEEFEVKNDENKVIKYIINKEFDKALEAFENGEYGVYDFGIFVTATLRYDVKLVDEIFEILAVLLDEENRRIYYYTYGLEALIDDGRIELFEKYLNIPNLEENIYKISLLLSSQIYDVEKQYYLHYFGSNLVMNNSSEVLKEEGKKYLLGWYFIQKDYDNFVKLFESLDEQSYVDVGDFINTTMNFDVEIFKYLLNKNRVELAPIYNNCFFEIINKKYDEVSDLELAKKIIDTLDVFIESRDEKMYVSSTCVETKRGMYLYAIGEKKKAEVHFSLSAYMSPDYCTCGVGALMTYYDFEYEESDELNKEIALNALNGKKLVGKDKFEEKSFSVHNDIVCYYAYYALKKEKGFDLEKALDAFDFLELCYAPLYYVIKIAYELGYTDMVEYYLDKMKKKTFQGFLVGDEKYLEIIDDIECPLHRPEAFYKF